MTGFSWRWWTVRDRSTLAETSYDKLWGRDDVIATNASRCVRCPHCEVELACPTSAVVLGDEGPIIDPLRCFNCGTCLIKCPHECFQASLGAVRLDIGGLPRTIPIVGRGSSREGARRTMVDLKERMLDRRFLLTPKVADIRP